MRKLLCLFLGITLLCLAACGTSPEPPNESASGEITAEEITFPFPDITSADDASTQPDLPVGAQPNDVEDGQNTTYVIPEAVTVVIPEGFTFYQVARRLEANGVCSAADFTEAAQNYQIQSFYAPVSPQACYRMEGMLFPDTYEFYKGDDPVAVLRKMLNNYAEKTGLPDYDTLILASVIERETRSDEHMAMVSSVFHNRLRINMPLQADATRAYVRDHIKADPLLKNPERFDELYDTYQCPALPEGPICSPGLRAIEAAKNPSTSDYLYYFFGKDETNHYTYTYDEHLAAIKMYGIGL